MSSGNKPATLPEGGAATSSQSARVQQQQQLRRAVYVHVSDLTSAYNIDHGRLEEELARVKLEQSKGVDRMAPARLGGVPTELDTGASQRRLQPPRAGYNLCVLVRNVNIVVDKNRVDGSRVRLAEVEVGDETGTVSLRARDAQIDVLKEVSERSGAVVLRNCTLELYQGKHIRLAITKWGKLSVYPDKIASTPPPPSKINSDRNFSLIDLSLVASEMAAFSNSESFRPSAEVENQSLSTANRSQQYHANAPGQRRANSRRGPSYAKQQIPPMPPAQLYSDPSLQNAMPVRAYQGGLHGYGAMDSHIYPYPHRQAESVPTPPHQMMLHQQYEMQHRQMHHHMYQHQQHHHHHHQQASQHEQLMPSSSPMISTGGLVPTASFDTSFGPTIGGQEVSMPARVANPFLMPLQVATHGQGPRGNTPHSETRDISSPRMNPQASSFDPSITATTDRNQYSEND